MTDEDLAARVEQQVGAGLDRIVARRTRPVRDDDYGIAFGQLPDDPDDAGG